VAAEIQEQQASLVAILWKCTPVSCLHTVTY